MAGAEQQSSAKHAAVAPMHSALPAAAAQELPCSSMQFITRVIFALFLLLLVARPSVALHRAVLAALLVMHAVLCLLQPVPKG